MDPAPRASRKLHGGCRCWSGSCAHSGRRLPDSFFFTLPSRLTLYRLRWGKRLPDCEKLRRRPAALSPEGPYVLCLSLGPEIVDLSGLKTPQSLGNTLKKWGASPPAFFQGIREALRCFLSQENLQFLAKHQCLKRCEYDCDRQILGGS